NLPDSTLKSENENAEVFVLCESIYSMDGDIAPLEELAELCSKKGWHLIVDEAHGVGLAGKEGEGLVAGLELNDKVFATVVTYGKAFGCAGGMVLSDKRLRDYLINFSKPFIYSTGPSNIQVMAVQQAYKIVKNANKEREKIKALKLLFTELTGLQSSGQGAIISWLVSGNKEVMDLSIQLEKTGLDIRPIRYPTVAKGTERLRISIHAYNTEEEIKLLAAVLNKPSKKKY
ncbi:MAG: 8-amino-7-oxononanoate synthase, partial [Limisphaerales bacterium]